VEGVAVEEVGGVVLTGEVVVLEEVRTGRMCARLTGDMDYSW
jgi:hypothetical protein